MSNYNKALKETTKEIEEWYNLNNWEEVPDEDLWQDGELNSNQLMDLLYIRIIQEGKWRVIRRK